VDWKEKKLATLAVTPAAALGSCRLKLPDPRSEGADSIYDTLFDFFEKHMIRYFFYIGGNDSMDTVSKLSMASLSRSWKIFCIGIPKTIDNDLCGTDHTPGFGSSAKYIAATMQDILYDCSVYTIPSVTIVEIMGRDSGWLTCAAALPTKNGLGPDYLYLPEVPFETDRFVNDLKEAHQKHPSVVVAVSEGIRYADGRYVGESTQSGATDVFGHKYLTGAAKALEFVVQQHIGCKVRSFDLNLPQRCASYMLSATDIQESREVGIEAVLEAEKGNSGVMISYVRTDNPYTIRYQAKSVYEIANQVKTVPLNYINEKGNGVTDACLDYLLPLVKGEVCQEYRNGIPLHIRIQ
jgi:6-phosphofructokinase 1